MAAAAMSCAASLRLLPFKPNLFASSVQYPAKALILRPLKPSELPSFRRTIITFQKISTGNVRPPSASPPSSSEDFQPIEELPPELQEIVKLFQSVQEPRAKYRQLIFYGEHLKPLDPQFKTRENKVEGCVSQVWVRAFFDDQRNVVYEADSDSSITKGLAALLVQGLSGRPVPEILRVTPDFALLLGLQQSLSPSRNNGFLNMLKLMQKKALHLEVKGEEDSSSEESLESSFVPTPETNGGVSVVDKDTESKPSFVEDLGAEDSDGGSDVVALGSRGMRIREKLEKELNPVELEVEDVSYQHAGHAAVRGSAGDDGETHFNLRIVSDAFQGKSLVKRHRMIYDLLQEELKNGLHALSIVAKTPAEV
ncbi:PREDICTED: sufE-like protein 1, chloroplastic/mitochondrial [Camelina sativa]|uniref:SufE-like protein 1, chloroplastic/mitochondrial n=1 Tax=Camelina sativa TaxID=90675 RepID=A0ABM0TZ37_CAMSA|nr:PREDICTED: sufE-like protein 1, chloroplastic/mitochondrial [Camelina sativa]